MNQTGAGTSERGTAVPSCERTAVYATMARMNAKYSEETKAAVMAALLTGQSVSSVARDYNLPKGTVSNWKRGIGTGEGIKKRTQKSERIGELLIDYLESNLTALKAQTVVFADHAWLRKQTAENAAVLHGVLTDKAVRLLEALSHDASDSTPNS